MFPRRGAIALALTTVALIVLINFKTPDQVVENDQRVEQRLDRDRRLDRDDRVRHQRLDRHDRIHGLERLDRDARPDRDRPVEHGRHDRHRPRGRQRVRAGPGRDHGQRREGRRRRRRPAAVGRALGRISRAAAPILREEALQAQSANIDTVSGATYTSEAYAQSLQAALDSAGL